MPDSKNIEYWEQLFMEACALIRAEVRYALQKYNYGAPPEEVEELSEQITFLLWEDDYRRLKTYDPTKGKLKTWLRPVVRHEVSHSLRKQPFSEPIEEIAETQVSAVATQDEEVQAKEERALLDKAIVQLTPHDQRIAYLKLNDATDEEIAQVMQIKPRSVQQEWSKIGKKLKTIIEKWGGGQNLCHVEELRKIFSLRRQQFAVAAL